MKNRLPFSEEKEEVFTSKVKLNNEKSKFAVETKSREEFTEKANEYLDEKQIRNQKAFDLSKKFLNCLNNKTLPENKGPLDKAYEREVIKNLTDLAIEINSDTTELSCMGSTGIDILILKSFLSIRDEINKLSFQISQLKSEK